MVSTQIVLPVVDRLREMGVRARPLLSALSIDRNVLDDVDASIPFRKYIQFFENAAEAAGNPFFGLEAGTNVEVSTGAINFLFLSAPTLFDAFTGLQQYLEVLQESSYCRLTLEGTQARLTYQVTDDSIAPRRQDSEYSIVATCKLIASYLNQPFAPDEVWFEHERAGAHASYKEILGCDVFFEQSSNVILFDKNLLHVAAPSISRKLYPIIASHLQNIMSSRMRVTSFSGELAALLDQRLLAKGASARRIAAMLDVSESTLARRLRADGTSFIKVLTTKRMTVAQRLLAHSQTPIAEIALMVGYAENASFSRAFKAWGGVTPEHYRSSNRNLA